MKRELDIVVISDVHLGTYGCHARELYNYLKSIEPRTLFLNGDIFDMWQFKKSYFPKEHMEIVRRLLKMAVNGTKVYYLTGNHDDVLRKFGEVSLGLIHLRNKLVFQVDGKTHWVFHGDVFDPSVQRARWLAKLGSEGYDLLIRINRSINKCRQLFGLKPSSFSARVKKGVKGAVRYIGDFEDIAIQIAAENGYDCVICGHIHQPQIREVVAKNGHKVCYMNSGDWVEHLTALECKAGKWELYQYHKADFSMPNPLLQVPDRERQNLHVLREELSAKPQGLAAFEWVV
ncbi:MAG: UDP-2,3-diacylglucosamine diphosphatase [Saprospiraceae bacterium]|nr:UDP-2,3-diacylglucosamine diphosphatase [Saprospiraceae bacterium]